LDFWELISSRNFFWGRKWILQRKDGKFLGELYPQESLRTSMYKYLELLSPMEFISIHILPS
jgi:hypothetical protein